MIGVLDADPAGAASLGHVHGEAISVRADDESQAVVAIDCGGAGGGKQHPDLRLGGYAAPREPVGKAMQGGGAPAGETPPRPRSEGVSRAGPLPPRDTPQ